MASPRAMACSRRRRSRDQAVRARWRDLVWLWVILLTPPYRGDWSCISWVMAQFEGRLRIELERERQQRHYLPLEHEGLKDLERKVIFDEDIDCCSNQVVIRRETAQWTKDVDRISIVSVNKDFRAFSGFLFDIYDCGDDAKCFVIKNYIRRYVDRSGSIVPIFRDWVPETHPLRARVTVDNEVCYGRSPWNGLKKMYARGALDVG